MSSNVYLSLRIISGNMMWLFFSCISRSIAALLNLCWHMSC